MPNIKSAKKRMLTSEKSRQGNKSVKSRITTVRRRFYAAVGGEGSEQGLAGGSEADVRDVGWCAADAAVRDGARTTSGNASELRTAHGSAVGLKQPTHSDYVAWLSRAE